MNFNCRESYSDVLMSSVSIKNLSFSYPKSSLLLDGIDLTFGSGKTAILGPNGAGKTTLISLLATALTPRLGSIRLVTSTMDISSKELRAFRKNVAWLPQDFSPVAGLSALEHVMYSAWLKGATRKEAREAAPAALEQVGLSEMSKHKSTELSGGQQRRLGLAGALAHDASVILLDEPTAGLDPNQRERFQRILQDMDPKKIVLVSTHQTEDIDGTFDAVFVLDQGRQKFHGYTTKFMDLGGGPDVDPRDRIRAAYAQLVVGER